MPKFFRALRDSVPQPNQRNMTNVGIIGFGYWGPNLVRNFNGLDNCNVTYLSDLRPARLEAVNKMYPSITTTSDSNELINADQVDAVVIATPVFTHHKLAKQALEAGKHVLLEKPMTSTAAEAEELIALATEKGLTLMVDHTYLYTGAVRKIKEMVQDGTIGQVKYLDSTRINLGLFQPDINVLWDLAPHDISILAFLADEKPVSVNATGTSHTANGIENIAYLTVNFSSDFIAHFNCSWTSPVKLRNLLIGGDKKMIVFNDLEPTEKIKVYDTGYDVQTDDEKKRIMVDYRTGDIFIPKIEMTEALKGVASDFLHCIKTGDTPVSSAELGLSVVKVLEASNESIRNQGKEVIL